MAWPPHTGVTATEKPVSSTVRGYSGGKARLRSKWLLPRGKSSMRAANSAAEALLRTSQRYSPTLMARSLRTGRGSPSLCRFLRRRTLEARRVEEDVYPERYCTGRRGVQKTLASGQPEGRSGGEWGREETRGGPAGSAVELAAPVGGNHRGAAAGRLSTACGPGLPSRRGPL